MEPLNRINLTYINAMFEQAYKRYTNDTLMKMKIEI